MTEKPENAKDAVYYPKHLDDSGKQAVDKLHSDIKSRSVVRKEDPNTHIKVLGESTNPFGVSTIKFSALTDGKKFTGNGYSYTPGMWPFDFVAVDKSLLNLIESTEIRLVRFWKQCSLETKQQQKFMHRLRGEIHFWSFAKTRYEATTSDLKRKMKATADELQSLIGKLQESRMLSGIANDVIHKALDERHFEVFEEKNPSWNMWDDNPLRMDDLLARVLERVNEEAEQETYFPAWYPTKMESKSADKIFLMRAIQRVLIEIFSKSSHVLIADMVSIILEEIVTEDDVRKNLIDAKRNIPAKASQ